MKALLKANRSRFVLSFVIMFFVMLMTVHYSTNGWNDFLQPSVMSLTIAGSLFMGFMPRDSRTRRTSDSYTS